MQKQAPTFGRLLTMVALRAVVLRAAAVPVAVVRRPDPAQAEGLPLRRSRSPRPTQLGARGRRARRRRDGRQGAQEASSTRAATARSRRSSSTAATRRCSADARAILRQKTLLGETYVELTPGTSAPRRARGRPAARRAASQDTVELDEILSALDPHDARRRSATGSRTLARGDRRPRPRPQRRARQPAGFADDGARRARGARRAGARAAAAWSRTPAWCSAR